MLSPSVSLQNCTYCNGFVRCFNRFAEPLGCLCLNLPSLRRRWQLWGCSRIASRRCKHRKLYVVQLSNFCVKIKRLREGSWLSNPPAALIQQVICFHLTNLGLRSPGCRASERLYGVPMCYAMTNAGLSNLLHLVKKPHDFDGAIHYEIGLSLLRPSN